jgi:hypothetical protein
MLFAFEETKELFMIHGLEGGFTLFKGTSRRNRITLQEWIKMPVDLHGNASDMGGNVVSRPPCTRRDGVGIGAGDGLEECFRFATSVNHAESTLNQTTPSNYWRCSVRPT